MLMRELFKLPFLYKLITLRVCRAVFCHLFVSKIKHNLKRESKTNSKLQVHIRNEVGTLRGTLTSEGYRFVRLTCKLWLAALT